MGSPPAPAPPGRPENADTRLRTGFAVVGLLFFATMGYGTVTTPLWPLYQERDGFGPTMVTVVFSMYAAGTVATLVFAGSLSDRFGRTRILAAAAALGVASVLVFLLWQSVPGLLAARLVQGMGVGLTTSTATAAMVELGHRGAVRRPATSATTATTLANLGGLGAGALLGGMISEWIPGPLTAPFLFFGAALAVAGLALTLVPVILADVLTAPGRVLSGVLVMLVMGTAAGAQLLLRNARARTLAAAGAVLYPAGWLLTALAVHSSSLALFVVSAVVAGTAAGLLFKAGSVTVDRIADPQRRAGAHSGFFLVSYIGMALPVIGLAALGGLIGTVPSVLILGLVLAAVAAAGIAVAGLAGARPPGR